MTVDGGLSVEEALVTEVTGVVAVKGYLFDGGTGLRLCSVLAEPFPPECGRASLAVEGFDFDRMIKLAEYEPVQIENTGGATWTDGPVAEELAKAALGDDVARLPAIDSSHDDVGREVVVRIRIIALPGQAAPVG